MARAQQMKAHRQKRIVVGQGLADQGVLKAELKKQEMAQTKKLTSVPADVAVKTSTINKSISLTN